MDYPEQPQFPRGEVDSGELKGRHRFSWDALQREWKTPPLWGVADSAPYLHDGRAAMLGEAIQWHGGEAEPSNRKFAQLNEDQQERLLAFLRSLKAPQGGFDKGMEDRGMADKGMEDRGMADRGIKDRGIKPASSRLAAAPQR